MQPITDSAPEFVPDGLYDRTLLLGAWDASDPLSYAKTFDAESYRKATLAGLRIPRDDATARARALHDTSITRALDKAVEGRKVVAFMGGHNLQRDSDAYRMVAECARTLSRHELLVVSGGGPGAMEAAHLGARLAPTSDDALDEALAMLKRASTFPHFKGTDLVDGSGTFDQSLLEVLHAWQCPAFEVADRWPEADAGQSIGIPTWLYGHEPPTPLATSHAKYFENSVREDGLLAIAKAGVIFAEGSAGTLQEVFQDAAQNYYESVDGTRSPMVFLDLDEFWSVRRPVRLLLEGLFDESQESLLHFVTSAGDAVRAIVASGPIPTTAAAIQQ